MAKVTKIKAEKTAIKKQAVKPVKASVKPAEEKTSPAESTDKTFLQGSSPEQGSSPDMGSSPEQAFSAEQGSSPDQGSSPEEKGSDLAFVGAGLPSVIPGTLELRGESLCVVIPYRKEPAAGEELRYALRAWAKNLPGVSIVVIGDKEDWFSPLVGHIQAKALSDNPQIDVASKLLIAIGSDLIPDRFILSNDDIFAVTPLHIADLEVLTCNGKLPSGAPLPNSLYSINKKRTVDALLAAKLPIWDYSTHTPFIFEKEKLADVIAAHRADQQGHLVSSLYFNTYYPEVVPLRVDPGRNGSYMCCVHRSDPDREVLKLALKTRKFVNVNNAGLKAVLPYLKEMFPDKSPFEK